MLILLAALIIAAAVIFTGGRVVQAIGAAREPGRAPGEQGLTDVVALFTPGIAAAAEDPRALLIWQPIAVAMRQLLPREFAALDQAFGRTFPFTLEQLQASHARWTTDWLEWERSHDGDCKLKSAAIEDELGARVNSPYGRTRLEAVEREKLERYQRRYEQYTRISRALQSLIAGATAPAQ